MMMLGRPQLSPRGKHTAQKVVDMLACFYDVRTVSNVRSFDDVISSHDSTLGSCHGSFKHHQTCGDMFIPDILTWPACADCVGLEHPLLALHLGWYNSSA